MIIYNEMIITVAMYVRMEYASQPAGMFTCLTTEGEVR